MEAKSEIKYLQSIHNILFDLNNDNIDDIVKSTIEIFDASYFHSFNVILFECIYASFLSQRKDIDVYLQYLKAIEAKERQILQKDPQLFKAFSEFLLDSTENEANFILYHLLEQKLIDPKFVKARDSIYFMHLSPGYRAYGRNMSQLGFLTFDELSANNFEKHKKLAFEGTNPSEVAKAIQSDDVEKLQKIASQSSFDFNKKISFAYEKYSFINSIRSNLFERFCNKLSLIEYAAFFGSIECFKYLMLNGSDYTNSLRYAVAGGNIEIIHYCEKVNADIGVAMPDAIKYHRNDIVHYIYDICYLQKDISESSNFKLFKKIKFGISNDKSQPSNQQTFGANTKADKSNPFSFSLDTFNPSKATFKNQSDSSSQPKFGLALQLNNEEEEEGNFMFGRHMNQPFHGNPMFGNQPQFNFNHFGGQPMFNQQYARKSLFGDIQNEKEQQKRNVTFTIYTDIDLYRFCINSYNYEILSYLQEEGLTFNDTLNNKIITKGNFYLFKYFNEGKATTNEDFYLSIFSNNVELVSYILSNGDININIKDDDLITPLIISCKKGYYEIVEFLIKQKNIELNMKENSGSTALIEAIANEHKEISKLLIEQKEININAKNKRGSTPLIIATKNNDNEICKLLLQRPEIDVNSKDQKGLSPIILAIQNNNYEIVKLLLDNENININERNNLGETLLMIATKNSNIEIVELLLRNNNINLDLNDFEGNNVFMKTNDIEIFKVLYTANNNFNINQKNYNGETALMIATKNSNIEIVKFLLELKDIDINIKDDEGKTAIYYANTLISELLIKRKEINLIYYPTYLIDQSKKGNTIIVNYLLQNYKFDVNLKDDNGFTALIYACWNGNLEIVKLLLQNKEVNINIKDSHYNMTALMFACSNYHTKIILLLLQNKEIDVNVKSFSGLTAIDIAANRHKFDLVELLKKQKGIIYDEQNLTKYSLEKLIQFQQNFNIRSHFLHEKF